MARTVDERIVKLQVDNGGFESTLAKSKASLGNFFSGLSRMGQSDPTAKIATGAQNASKALDGIGASSSVVTSRFSALSAMATGALLTIGSRAVQTGAQIVKSMTLDPVMNGFNQYQEKMKSVGVISANTGESMGKINGVLDDMSDYATKTIYSFSDMTKNLGTFTAAGVKLDVAKDSIKGISNLAATVGSNSQQAGMAMYQLSQAISAGKVGLQDWNSVVNAGMGGQKFQKALESTAAEMGHARDKTKSFRDSLQDGWITSEVLTKTLSKFAKDKDMLKMATQAHTFGDAMDAIKEDAMSGWAKMFESLIGGYESSTKVWTGLQQFGSNVVSVIPSYFQRIGQAMRKVGSDGKAPMDNIVNSVKSIGTSLRIILNGPLSFLKAAFKAIGNTGEAVFTKGIPGALQVVAGILMRVASVVQGINPLFKALGNVAHKVMSTIGNIVSKTFSTIGTITVKIFKGISSAALDVVNFFKSTWQTIKGYLSAPFSAGKSLIGREIQSFVSSFTSTFGKLQSPLDDFKEAWSNIKEALHNVGEAGIHMLKALVPSDTKLGKFLEEISTKSTNMLDSIKPGKQQWIKDFSSKILDWSKSIEKGTAKLDGWIDKTKDWVKNNKTLQSTFEKIKKGFSDIMDALSTPVVSANSTSKAGDGLTTLKDKVAGTKDPIGVALDFITTKFGELNKVLKDPAIKTAIITFSILAVSFKAFTVATNAIKEFSATLQSFRKSTKTLMGAIKGVPESISAMFKGISTAFGFLSKSVGKAVLILAWAFGIKQLSDALATLASIPTGQITKGVVTVATMMGMLTLAIVMMEKYLSAATGKHLIGTAILLLGMAEAIRILGNTALMMSQLNILQTAINLGVLTLALWALTKAVGDAKFDMKAGVVMMGMALAMIALAGALALISMIPMNAMANSITAIALVLAALGLTAKGLSLGSAATILALGIALGVMAVSLALLSSIPIQALGGALLVLAGAMVVFLGTAALIGVMSGLIGAAAVPMLAFGAAILIMGAGMALAGVAIVIFATTFTVAAAAIVAGLAILIAGLVALAPTVLANAGSLVGMALVMAPLIVVIGLLAVAVVILGAGMVIAGVGMVLLAAGLAAIGLAAPIAAAGLVAFVTIIMTLQGQMSGFIGVCAAVATGIGLIGVGAAVLGVGAAVLAVGIVALSLAFLALGVALALTGVLVLAFAVSFSKAIEIMLTALSFIPGIGGKFKDAANGIKNSGMDKEAADQSKKVTDSIKGASKGAGDAASNVGKSAKGGLTSGLNGIGGIGKKGGSDATSGLASMTGAAGSKGTLLGTNSKHGLSSGLGGMFNAGRKGGSDAASGLGSMTGSINGRGRSLGSNATSGARSGSSGMYGLGQNAGGSFGSGISSMVGSVISRAASLAKSAVDTVKRWLHIGSPSKVMKQIGRWTGEGLSIGMTQRVSQVSNTAQRLATQVTNAMGDIASTANDALTSNLDMTPTISPVLDASSLQNASMRSIHLGATMDDSLSTLQANKQAQTVKVDSADLNAKLDQLIAAKTGDSTEVHIDNIYGSIDEKTARTWAPTLATAFEKVKR